ncbi:hypothetical protein F7Q99_36175 [Streptomyces kaniharaensis]|uniref:Uncharacterized protein n=1 Tax=Streptomyces kaniharaensis TaxID=212423 RepID=A0A6N7L162_9ACTN|nr:hypothetical protein [Streptomyces kaniharaensis]MQS17480.1 hypothetical protein [Streptomyces kaniharaensis]
MSTTQAGWLPADIEPPEKGTTMTTNTRAAEPGPSAYLAASLAPTPRNIASAAEAIAKITATGWEPLSGYPGSDVLWRVRCLLCGWEGDRFFSHLRRGRPVFRHPGCLPADQRAEKLAEITQRLKPSCTCVFAHPLTREDARQVLDALAEARRLGDGPGLLICLARLLGPCPAAAARSQAVQAAQTLES